MPLLLIIKGLLLGIGLSLPIGPVGILCLRHSLTKGRAAGMIAGLGAATADLVYATCAAYGMTFIINPIQQHYTFFHALAGLFLISFGTHLYIFPPKSSKKIFDQGKKYGLFNYLSAFALTLSNPTTILLFVTLFTLLGINDVAQVPFNANILIGSIFIGACIGWLTLTSSVHYFRDQLSVQTLSMINACTSIGIILFGAITLVTGIASLRR